MILYKYLQECSKGRSYWLAGQPLIEAGSRDLHPKFMVSLEFILPGFRTGVPGSWVALCADR